MAGMVRAQWSWIRGSDVALHDFTHLIVGLFRIWKPTWDTMLPLWHHLTCCDWLRWLWTNHPYSRFSTRIQGQFMVIDRPDRQESITVQPWECFTWFSASSDIILFSYQRASWVWFPLESFRRHGNIQNSSPPSRVLPRITQPQTRIGASFPFDRNIT